MGKRIATRRRGKGSSTYRSPSHRHHGKVSHPPFEDEEGSVRDIFRSPGRTATMARVSFPSGAIIRTFPDGKETLAMVAVLPGLRKMSLTEPSSSSKGGWETLPWCL